MTSAELTDVFSALARDDFSVDMRVTVYSKDRGHEAIPILHPFTSTALLSSESLPFRTLCKAVVALSRPGVGFQAGVAFKGLTKELLSRARLPWGSEGALTQKNWLEVARGLNSMAKSGLSENQALRDAQVEFMWEFKQLLTEQVGRKEERARPAVMVLLIQGLRMMEGETKSTDHWKTLQLGVVDSACSCGLVQSTLATLAKVDLYDRETSNVRSLLHTPKPNALIVTHSLRHCCDTVYPNHAKQMST